MQKSPVRVYEKIKNDDDKVIRVVMTNEVVGIPFVMDVHSKIVEPPHGRIRVDGATTNDKERYWLPPAHYTQAYKMAAKILRDSRA